MTSILTLPGITSTRVPTKRLSVHARWGAVPERNAAALGILP